MLSGRVLEVIVEWSNFHLQSELMTCCYVRAQLYVKRLEKKFNMLRLRNLCMAELDVIHHEFMMPNLMLNLHNVNFSVLKRTWWVLV